MHYPEVSRNYPWLPHNQDPSIPVPPELDGRVIQPLGDRQSFYENNIRGCVEFYGGVDGPGDRCLINEGARVEMSLRQPKSMVNYTELGYTKIRAPKEVMDLLTEFWNTNKDKATNEKWARGYVTCY